MKVVRETDIPGMLQSFRQGDYGSVVLSFLVHVGSWSLGFSVDMWSKGFVVLLGLGPWEPRLLKAGGGPVTLYLRGPALGGE